MTRLQHRHRHNFDDDKGAETSRTWLRTTSTRLFAHFRCIRASSSDDIFHLGSKKSSQKFMDEFNLLSGDDAEEKTSTYNATTHHTFSATGRNCGWWRITQALTGRNCGWWRLAAMYSSVLMLGVGGSDAGGRLHRRYATMQGLLGVICVYLSYVGVFWGWVISYFTVPYLTPSLPNMGFRGFPRHLFSRSHGPCRGLLHVALLMLAVASLQGSLARSFEARATPTCSMLASRTQPQWLAQPTMAGSIGEGREIHNHDLTQVPLPKLMVLGSKWGGARKHKHDRIPTSELLHVAGHFQIVLELGNATTLAQSAQWGWTHVQHEASAPAILWRSGSFELLSHDALQLVTHSGKWAGSALVAKFRSIRPGWTNLTLVLRHSHPHKNYPDKIYPRRLLLLSLTRRKAIFVCPLWAAERNGDGKQLHHAGNLKRLTGPDRATPYDALVAWMRIHQGKLVDHSVVMINALLSNSTSHLPTPKPAAPLTGLTSSIPLAHADASSSTCRQAPGHATSSSSASPIAPVQATASSSGAPLQNAARICLSLAQAEALLHGRSWHSSLSTSEVGPYCIAYACE